MGIDALKQYEISEAEAERPTLEMAKLAAGETHFAPSQAPTYEYGVDYRGAWEDPFAGVQTAVRAHARALARQGCPVWLQSLGHKIIIMGKTTLAHDDVIPTFVKQQTAPLLTRKHKHALAMIEHRIFDIEGLSNLVYPPRMAHFEPAYRERLNAATILFTVFERSQPDAQTKSIAPALNQLGAIWVPCEHNRQVLVASGVSEEKVAVVPHPVEDDDPTWEAKPSRHGNIVTFLNIGKWEPRKGQHELIGGFLSAFFPSENAQLVLKYHDFGAWADYPTCPQESLARWLEMPTIKARGWTHNNVAKRVRLFDSFLTRAGLVGFLAGADVYVSAGRAEGFDLPARDAKLLGLRLVVMGDGGARSFARKGDIVCDAPSIIAHPGYGWRDAMWSGYGVLDVAKTLREAYAKQIAGEASCKIDGAPYRMHTVGSLMLSQVLRISEVMGGPGRIDPVQEYQNA